MVPLLKEMFWAGLFQKSRPDGFNLECTIIGGKVAKPVVGEFGEWWSGE
jgi:hypothetical protein